MFLTYTYRAFYSQMSSNYGKLFVSLGDTIRNAYYYESITKPYVLAVSGSTMDKLSPKPEMSKVLQLKIRNIDDPVKVYLSAE